MIYLQGHKEMHYNGFLCEEEMDMGSMNQERTKQNKGLIV